MGFLQKPQVTHTKDYLEFLKPDLCVPVSTMNSEDPVSEVSLSAGSNTISSYSEMVCVLTQHLLQTTGRLQCLESNLQVGYKVSGVFIALD